MNKRYRRLNNYYILDEKYHKKLSHEEIIVRLNHQERIIRMKSNLIRDLVEQNRILEEQNKNKPPNKMIKSPIMKLPELKLEPINLNKNDEEQIKKQFHEALEIIEKYD